MNIESVTDREFAIPYAVSGWTAALILGLTMFFEQAGVIGGGGQAAVWFRLGGGWIALLMASLVWVVVSEPIRLERRVDEATSQLQRSEARYRRLYDQAPLAYMTVDAEGRIQAVNDRFEEKLGHAADAVEGRPIGELFDKDPAGSSTGQDLLARFHAEGLVRGDELAVETVDGQTRWLQITMRSAEPSETRGDRARILAMMMDITDRKRVEARLEYYARQLEQSNEDLKQFASIVSHDLQEPLRMITGYLDLLDEGSGQALPEDAQKFIHHARDGADRMNVLIKSLLEYSRVDAGKATRDKVDLEEIVDDVTADLALRIEESNVSIEVGRLPTVQADPAQLRQVVQNLVGNAITHGSEDPRIRISSQTTAEGHTIMVEDDGEGIPPAERDRVFNAFHRIGDRPDESGTGMGLAICRRILERHGGRIGVTKGELGGACFCFELPSEPTIQAVGRPGVGPIEELGGHDPANQKPSGKTSNYGGPR